MSFHSSSVSVVMDPLTGHCLCFAHAWRMGHCAAFCPADLDRNGSVTGSDLGLLLGNWGSVGSGDLDLDGTIGGADLGLLLGAWGACPPPPPP